MPIDNFFTERASKAIPGPAPDPGLALARAAHMLLELSQIPQLESEVSPWVIKIVRAHMRRLDPEWSAALSGFGTRTPMSLPGPMRFRAELNDLAQAGFHGITSMLHQTFNHLETMIELVHQLDEDAYARVLAAVALCAPPPVAVPEEWGNVLPVVLEIFDEYHTILAQAIPGFPNQAVDYRLHAYLAEGAVLNELWSPVDGAAERLCIGPMRIHRWIREDGFDSRPEGGGRQRRTVCLGTLCGMTRARWLLPFHTPEPVVYASFASGGLTFVRNITPVMLDDKRVHTRPDPS